MLLLFLYYYYYLKKRCEILHKNVLFFYARKRNHKTYKDLYKNSKYSSRIELSASNSRNIALIRNMNYIQMEKLNLFCNT